MFGLRVYVGGDLVVWGGIGAVVAWQLQGTSAQGLIDWAGLYLAAILISIAVHELAHAAVGWMFKLGVRHVFIGILGGHTMLRIADPPPAKELAVVAAGPLSNLVLAGALFLAFDARFSGSGFLGVLVWVNVVLGASNLLPIGGLDGSKAVRAVVNSYVPERLEATRVARIWSALLLVAALGGPAVWLIWQGYWFGWVLVFNAVWFSRGIFEPATGEDALAALGGLTAEAVMEHGIVCRPETLLSRVIQRHLSSEGRDAARPFVVMSENGTVHGVLTPATLQAARSSPVDWRIAVAADAMAPVREIPVVHPDTPAATIVVLAGDSESDVVLVVDEEGELIGCVTLGVLDRVARERMAA